MVVSVLVGEWLLNHSQGERFGWLVEDPMKRCHTGILAAMVMIQFCLFGDWAWIIRLIIDSWNLFVLYFWASTLQNKALSNQNKGHLGSRLLILKNFWELSWRQWEVSCGFRTASWGRGRWCFRWATLEDCSVFPGNFSGVGFRNVPGWVVEIQGTQNNLISWNWVIL